MRKQAVIIYYIIIYRHISADQIQIMLRAARLAKAVPSALSLDCRIQTLRR